VLCCSLCSNLTRELLDYLAVCDSEFKPDLTAKIAALITRFAPDRRWHFDNLLCVLVQVRGAGVVAVCGNKGGGVVAVCGNNLFLQLQAWDGRMACAIEQGSFHNSAGWDLCGYVINMVCHLQMVNDTCTECSQLPQMRQEGGSKTCCVPNPCIANYCHYHSGSLCFYVSM
jgi:hypothetical protein